MFCKAKKVSNLPFATSKVDANLAKDLILHSMHITCLLNVSLSMSLNKMIHAMKP